MPVMHYLPRLNASILCGAQGALHATLNTLEVSCPHCTHALVETVPEHVFQAALRRVAVQEGWKVHCVYDSRKSPRGYPDLTLAKPGFPLQIWELKTVFGTPTIDQTQWLETLAQVRGVEVGLYRPEDMPRLVARLSAPR